MFLRYKNINTKNGIIGILYLTKAPKFGVDKPTTIPRNRQKTKQNNKKESLKIFEKKVPIPFVINNHNTKPTRIVFSIPENNIVGLPTSQI